MGVEGQISEERFLVRAALAAERAAQSNEHIQKKMWEDIAQCWRELARRCAPGHG